MPDREPTDAELIAACRAGDDRAFERLYYRHRDWIASVARRFCDDHEDALDVLQEVFAYLAREIPTLRLRHELTTFLYPVAKHRALDRVVVAQALDLGQLPGRALLERAQGRLQAGRRALEVGPGRVLSGLVARIDRSLERAAVGAHPDLDEGVAFVEGVTH